MTDWKVCNIRYVWVYAFYISTCNFHMNMVVLNRLPKFRHKWCFASAFFENTEIA